MSNKIFFEFQKETLNRFRIENNHSHAKLKETLSSQSRKSFAGFGASGGFGEIGVIVALDESFRNNDCVEEFFEKDGGRNLVDIFWSIIYCNRNENRKKKVVRQFRAEHKTDYPFKKENPIFFVDWKNSKLQGE